MLSLVLFACLVGVSVGAPPPPPCSDMEFYPSTHANHTRSRLTARCGSLCHSLGLPMSLPYDIAQCTSNPHQLSSKQRCLLLSDDVNPKVFKTSVDRCYIVLQGAILKHGIELPKHGHHCVFVLEGSRLPFVRGGDEGDLIEVLNGNVQLVEGGDGDDLLYAFGKSTNVGSINGKGGEDFLLVRSTTGVRSVSGGAGDDFIYVADNATADRVEGNDGDDLITIYNSTVFEVDTGSGSDKVGLYNVAINILDLGSDHDSDLVGYSGIYTPPIVYHDDSSDQLCLT